VFFIFLTVVLTVGYSVRFFAGVFFSHVGAHPYVSVGGWDRLITVAMLGLFGLSVFGGSIFVNFIDSLAGSPVSLRHQDKVLLVERILLGLLLFLSSRLVALFRGFVSYVVSSTAYNMWFLVSLSRQPFVGGYFFRTSTVKAVFDSGWFEVLGGVGSYVVVSRLVRLLASCGSLLSGFTVFGAGVCLVMVLFVF